MSGEKQLNIFKKMPDEILAHIFSFLGKSYGLIRLFSKSFKVFYDEYYKGLKKILLLDVVVSKSLWEWACENGCPWDRNQLFNASVKAGRLEVLQRARTNGCPWDERACKYAAENGHLEILQWARENGCPRGERTCASAAENGHLEILQWARENGCPRGERTCKYAAENGHLEIININMV